MYSAVDINGKLHTRSSDAGFLPGNRDPFLSGKGPKTIDVQSGQMRLDGRLGFRKAAQLAEFILSYAEGLKQGPIIFKSVHPEGQTAGVEQWAAGMKFRR